MTPLPIPQDWPASAFRDVDPGVSSRGRSAVVQAAVVRHLVVPALEATRGIGWQRKRDCAVTMLLQAGRGKSGTWRLAGRLVERANKAIRNGRRAQVQPHVG